MKFLTALTTEIELGYQPPNTALKDCRFESSGYKSLLSEQNTFLVLVCFEEGDLFDEIKEAAIRISNQYANFKQDAKTISLVPFSHLTSEAMSDEDQLELLMDKLHRVLAHKGHCVRWLPPSSGNLCFVRWVFFDKLHSVRFGSTQSGLKSTLKALLRAHGARTVLANLGDLLAFK